MQTVNQLKQNRASKFDVLDELITKAKNEDRDFNEDEASKFEVMALG